MARLTEHAFLHRLEPIRGYGPDLNCLMEIGDRSADEPVGAPGVDSYMFESGRVVHATAANKFELGATGSQMPIFLWPGEHDADISVNSTYNNVWGWSGVPEGPYSGFVATGSFLLETTEFDSEAEFATNDLLHSPTRAQAATVKAECGLLYKNQAWTGGSNAAFTLGTHNICGIVAPRGAGIQNHWKVDVLRFWTYLGLGTAGN